MASPRAVIESELEANFDFRCTLQRDDTAPKSSLATGTKLWLGPKSGANQIALHFVGENLHLMRNVKGKPTLLASAKAPGLPTKTQKIPFVLQWRDGALRVICDSRTVLRHQALGDLPKNAVLATTGGAFDFAQTQFQPIEPVSFADDFMRAPGDAGPWEAVSGEWKIRSSNDPAKVANAFTYTGKGKSAVSLAGRWFWDDYRVGAAMRPEGQSEIGLIVYWQDAKNYLLFRWLPEEDGSARGGEKQLWRVWRGQPMLIAATPGGYRAKQWYHLSVSANNGLISAAIDGQNVLQKRTDLFGQGKVGLYANGDQILVDDVTVEHASNADPKSVVHREAITSQFTKEQSMENWASPKSEWRPDTSATDATFWNRGTFFGDHAVEIKATALELNRAKIVAALCGDGKSALSGYSLLVTQGGDKERVEAVLMRGGKALTPSRSFKIDAATGAVIRLERNGRAVRALINQGVVAQYVDAAPLNGRRVAFSSQGAQVALSDANVSGGNVYDYTFHRAPTDWYVSGGTWDMTSRWDCSPDWSWYGGWSDRIAAIWNKHTFEGDFVMDVFAACKRDVGGYQHPRDINITLAGDGHDVGSGYSLIFGGWNNTSTRLMRGTQVVAETTKYLLPKDYQNQAHHKWFNLRVEKTGSTISLYIDRELALQYTDPKPLTGRRVALWTCGNGVMIARATLFYQKETATEPTPLLVQNRNWMPVAAAKLGWTSRGNDSSLRLEAVQMEQAASRTARASLVSAVRALNLTGGGQFAMTPELEAFDALKTPKLSFDCQLENGAAINLYLRVKGIWHSVRLTGPTRETELEQTKFLGAAKNVRADGRWHRVELDLSSLLKPLYPNDGEIRVEEVFLGNMTRDQYAQAGFGGNYPGATYLVRSFALRSVDNRIAKIVEPQLKSPVRKLIASSSLLPLTVPNNTEAAVKADAKTTPETARGLRDMRVTYCQDADGGEFKQEKLNQPIFWQCFTRPMFTDKVDSIDFDWADKAPHKGLNAKYWSARFYGKLIVPQAGEYVFAVDRLDDGARLSIDGQLVLDSWKIQAATSQESKPITLSPGVHDIRLDYSQGTGMGSLTLRWNGPGFAREVISKAARPAAAVQTAMNMGAR